MSLFPSIDKNATDIIIDKDTLEMFEKFYHNTSYAGELKINLLDKTVLGGFTKSLHLVMIKNIGDVNKNNSTYDFYLAFVSKVHYSDHTIVKKVYFDKFSNIYEPAFNVDAIEGLLTNINMKIVNQFAEEYFNCNIKIKCNLTPGKLESYRNNKNEIEIFDDSIKCSDCSIYGGISSSHNAFSIDINESSTRVVNPKELNLYNPHDY